MAWLKNLFGASDQGRAQPAGEDYEGFTITPTPIAEGSKFRISATITREVDGEVKEHRLIRADTLESKEAADEASINKAKQMIDQMGLGVFNM